MCRKVCIAIVCFAAQLSISLSSAQAGAVGRVEINVRIDGGSLCNDSISEWKTWLGKSAPARCNHSIEQITVDGGARLSGENAADLSNGTLRLDMMLISRYERVYPLCMASLAASAVYKVNEGDVAVFPTYNVLGWNSQNKSNLMGAIEREMLAYIEEICESAGD